MRTSERARSRGGSTLATVPPWQKRATARVGPAEVRTSSRGSVTPPSAAQRLPRPVAEIPGLEQAAADGRGSAPLLERSPDPAEQPAAQRDEDGQDQPHAQPAGEEEPHGRASAPQARRGTPGSRLAQPHDHLPGVAAAQEVEERGDGVLQSLAHGLPDDDV